MELKGKVILVTGGARRVGRSISLELASRGAMVIVHYRTSETEAEALVAEINGQGGFARAIQADLTLLDDVQRLIRTVEIEVGYIDVLVNNASVYFGTPLSTLSDADWDQVIGTNLTAPFRLARRVAGPMQNRGVGKIINLTDIHATRFHPGHLAYCVSKAGLDMLTRGLAIELAPTIQVNSVAPGAVLWPEDRSEAERDEIRSEIPLGREGTPEDVARAVRFLIEEDYITGETLTVDGGRTLA